MKSVVVLIVDIRGILMKKFYLIVELLRSCLLIFWNNCLLVFVFNIDFIFCGLFYKRKGGVYSVNVCVINSWYEI